MDFTELIDLASERLGGKVLAANDDFFASKRNLLKVAKPVFVEGKYTSRGKWMDGWETRRRRAPGHDWCILRLGLAGIIHGVVVDTSYFKGNYPEHCSIEGCAAAGKLSHAASWVEILPKSALQGDTQNLFAVNNPCRFTHLRLNIFPDGGVARFRVHGEAAPDAKKLHGEMDLAAIENGAYALVSSDMFFGNRHNLMMPGRAKNMSDGWETRRRRGPGHDWMIIRLAVAGTIWGLEVDTSHFKGNCPASCSLEACDSAGDPAVSTTWRELLPDTRLRPHTRHLFEEEIRDAGEVTHLRFNIFPDGGVARLRAFGTPSDRGRAKAGLRLFNAQLEWDAEGLLLHCCGSMNWAHGMAKRRPFHERNELLEEADRIWGELGREDCLEAFQRHPRIGEKAAQKPPSAKARAWSKQEQFGAGGASAKTRAELARANRDYESIFGYIFIVCATGKSAEQILALLKERMKHDPETELRQAKEEQRRITRLRLEKLLQS